MSDLNSLIIFAHAVDANCFSKAARLAAFLSYTTRDLNAYEPIILNPAVADVLHQTSVG